MRDACGRREWPRFRPENDGSDPDGPDAPAPAFSPGATSMIVDDARADGGPTWHSTVGPSRLNYVNAVAPADQGSTLRFSAELRGPAAAVMERLVPPLFALGQGRRMTRLAALADLVERHAG